MVGLTRKKRLELGSRTLLRLLGALLPKNPFHDQRVRIIASLRALMERENQYAERSDIDFGRVKLCYAGISAVENAVARVEKDLAEGRISAAQYRDELEARLRYALEQHESLWSDEDGFGSSTINSAIRIVANAAVSGR